MIYQDEWRPDGPDAAAAARPPSVRQCGGGDRRGEGGRLRAVASRRRPRHDQRRLAGTHAAADAGRAGRARRRAAPRSGSTAATIRAPASSSPRRWPSRRSACQRPLFLICGMLNTKDQTGYFRAFKGIARHVFTVPVASSEAGMPNAELAIAGRRGGAVGRAGELGRQRADAAARYLGPGRRRRRGS